MFDDENLRIEILIKEREAYENMFFQMEDISKSNELDFRIIQYESGNELFNPVALEEKLENLRIEILIKEREAYENMFFQMGDISKSNELDFRIIQYMSCHELFDPFALEEKLENSRIEILIKERETYEIQYFSNVSLDVVEKDFLDILIESYDENDHDAPDFNYFEDFMSVYQGYSGNEPIIMDKPTCGYDLDYIPNDDIFDDGNCYDYPEGPKENLWGIIYPF